jgi:hypothetical protein
LRRALDFADDNDPARAYEIVSRLAQVGQGMRITATTPSQSGPSSTPRPGGGDLSVRCPPTAAPKSCGP